MNEHQPFRVYKGDGDRLVEASKESPQCVMLPAGDPRTVRGVRRIRIQWGQHLLEDLVDGRYRTVICGVNDVDNERGILGELLKLIPTSQWTLASATSYAKMFRESVSVHAKEDREPYILKFDLDRLLILALLRPAGRDHFTLEDIYRGFRTVSKMLEGRRERQPVATISFLGAKSNRLASSKTPDGEPSLESILDAMHQAGYEGDLYPPASAWEVAPTSVFASYPFPESLERMREGSS